MLPDSDIRDDQLEAFHLLLSGENVFLTGAAGSGKSFLIRKFLEQFDDKNLFPVLASTGAAAVLVGGRTFHSFFGLGIMEGGPERVFEKAKKDGRLRKRINKVEGIIIDEISMISGDVLDLAERIARHARENEHPFGGLRVIAVGDFAQLPPVNKMGPRNWSFQHSVWQRMQFQKAHLRTNHRTQDAEFLSVLNDIRQGQVTQRVFEFLNDKIKIHDESDSGIRLFPFRNQSEQFNLKQLNKITAPVHVFPTLYWGDAGKIEKWKDTFPVPAELALKEGAEVIFTQNDPQKRWINGTQGVVRQVEDKRITVEKRSGRQVTVDPVSFDLLNAEGEVVMSATQYPLNLGYATTIHKSQGSTLDKVWCDLSQLWEPGQAYVALSRLRDSSGLNLIKWSRNSIKADEDVIAFYGSQA
ncbi:MAG: AAA family ATPase [Bdellovibrionaceae bacterium]|nr:AAA family ATPase [Pseudobdellovibrionaceae bacterium]